MRTSSNAQLQKLLAARGMDVDKVADQIFSSRPHLSQVINGRRRGMHTWPKLARVLSLNEYSVAKFFADARRHIPKETTQAEIAALEKDEQRKAERELQGVA